MSTKLTYTGAEVQELLDKIEKGGFDNAKTLEGHPASYFARASEFTSLAESFATEQGRINTLYSYFNNGSANDALRLGGQLPSYYATANQYEILQRTLSDFKSLFDSMFEKDSDGNIHAKLSLWSSGGITAGGVGSGGSGGGGGISYSRLDSWSDYSADKAGYVLSALLGKDLDDRVSALANAGYVTASALAPYALRSEIPSLVGYATQSWVGENYLSKSGGTMTGSLCVSMYGWNNQLVLNGVDSNAGIEFRYSNTYVAALSCTQSNPYWLMGENAYPILHSGNYSDYALSKNGGTMTGSLCVSMYGWNNQLVLNGVDSNAGIEFRYSNTYVAALSCAQSNPYWLMGENAYPILHSGNYTDYALPITGGTIYGGIGALKIKRSGTGNSYIEYQNDTETLGYIGFRAKGAPAYMDDATYIQYDLLHLYNYRDYVVATNGNSTINGSITAPSFIGNLTGNADSATKLATPRTIWGQSFDGTQDVTGALTAPSITANSLTIGGATITYDSVNEALCINGNMYALGGITAGAAGISAYSSLEARVARLEQQLNI